MRILILSQWFSPEPFFKGLPFAKALCDRGHDVQVLTGFPNYPGGQVYPGYRIALWQRQTLDGIPVLRVPLYPSHNRSKLGRMLNYASFALSAALLGSLLTGPADVIYVYHPPATIGLAAAVLRWVKGARVVYDIQDLWPDTIAATGMMDRSLPLKMVSKVCGWVYRNVDRIVVLSPGFRQKLIERNVPSEKIDVIYNWSNEAAIQSLPYDDRLAGELSIRGKFVVLFAGTMGAAQDLRTVQRAAAMVRESLPEVLFLLVGGGTEAAELKLRAEAAGLANVQFLPHQPVESMGHLFSLANVLLVHLRDHPLFRITIPSKTQVYLAMGKPILMAASGDAAELVRRAGAGIICQPGNEAAIADAVRRMLEMPESERAAMGRAGALYYTRELSMTHGVDRFEAIFEELSEQSSDSSEAHAQS